MPDQILTALQLLQATPELGWRLDAPFRFRLMLQPIVAILLGLRDGRLDARAGTPPYLSEFLLGPNRRAHLKSGLAAVTKPLILAIAMDSVVQWIFLDSLNPLAALLIGGLLVGLPYSVARGVTNRLLSSRRWPAE